MVINFAQTVFQPKIPAHKSRGLVEQLSCGQPGIQNFDRVTHDGLLHNGYQFMKFFRQLFRWRDFEL